MQFKVGEPVFFYGEHKLIRNTMHDLSLKLMKHCSKILFIDTTNSLNPHNKAYNSVFQKRFFKKIYCVRVPKPYDLWARLNTAENFIKVKKIEALLINSLSVLFEDAEKEEIKPLLDHILHRINYLTKKYNLITIIGNSPKEDENVMTVTKELLTKENIAMV